MARKIPWLDFSALFKRDQSDLYNTWSFPYGEPQRRAVEALLAQLFPGQDPVVTLSLYLSGRDLYRGRFQDFPVDQPEDRKLAALTLGLRDRLQNERRADLPLYAALVRADARVDEQLLYPTASQLREDAARLDL